MWHNLLAFFQQITAEVQAESAPQGADYIAIDLWQLALALGFVLLAGAFSRMYRLRLERDLFFGTIRLFTQLLAVGYVLHIVFAMQSLWLVLGMYTLTAWVAASLAARRVRGHGIPLLLPTFAAMFCTCFGVTLVVAIVILQATPWWKPQYFIPIGGMVAGNAMNAVAIALERFFNELHLRKGETEALLCLGASPAEATADMFRVAMRAGMINPINAMMGVGIVSLPGMMTGQILAGVSPIQAVRYQVVVLLMVTAAAALSSFISLRLVRGRCFTPGGALRAMGKGAQ